MTKALAWIRKSKGTDDDIGLEQQRREVRQLAEDIADTVDVLDLGVQTGFSTLTRDTDASQLLDELEPVQNAVETLRAGEYDVLVAWDDRRVSRDEFFNVIEHACVQGDCEFAYVSDDVQTDDLAFDIHRRVERQTKEEEIEKAKRATQERVESGCYQGTVPFGLRLADDGCHLEKHPVEWDSLKSIIDARREGESVSKLAREHEPSRATVYRIEDRGIEWYEELLAEYSG